MHKPITDVGIDLDGVLYPFASAFKTYCLERTGKTDLPDPTHWNFFEDWDLDSETFQAWLKEAAETHNVFSVLPPFEGVIEAWRDLRDLNVRIHILTARPHSAWIQTIQWLDRYKLHCDTLHFTHTKSMLIKLATGTAVLLDDHVAYYEEAERAGIVPCLMTRAWNNHLENATRVSTLPEFVSFIRGYNASYRTLAKNPGISAPYVAPKLPKVQTLTKTNPYKPHGPNEPRQIFIKSEKTFDDIWKNYNSEEN